MSELYEQNPKMKSLCDLIRNDLESYEGPRSKLTQRIKVRKQLYESELPRRQYRGRANIRVPFPYTWVESMVPRYMASIFVGRDVLDVLPRHNSTQDRARAAKYLLNYQLLFEAEFFWESYAFFKTLCSKGVSVCKVRWNEERQTPEIIQVAAEDWAQDTRSPIVERCAWVSQRVHMTRGELEQGAQQYAMDPNTGYHPEAVMRILESATPQVTFGSPGETVTVAKERGMYEVWEWWGQGDIGNGNEPLVAYYHNNMLLAARPSPYRKLVPFITMADVPDPWRFSDARSEMDSIESMYEAASDIVNQRMDNVTQNINGLTTVRKGTGVDVQKLISVPWGVLELEDHDDIKMHESKNVTGDAYKEVSAMMELMKMSTGLQDYQRGVENPSIDTASSASKLFEAANMRPGLKVKMMQFRYLKRMGEIFLIEDQMFMSQNKQAMILGEDMKTYIPVSVTPQDIEGLYDIQPMGFDLAGNRDTRINQMTSLLNVIRGVPPDDPAWPLVEEIVQMAELKSGDRILAAAAQRRQAMALVQQQQAQAQPGQAGAPVGQPGVVNNPKTPPSGQKTPMGPPVGSPKVGK